MPSSYSPLLRLTQPADGELVGTWGQTVNNGITALAEAAIAGTAGVALVDADYVMGTANGGPDVARNAVVRFTGALTAQRNIVVPSSSKIYIIRNDTTGGFGLNVKTAAGTGVVVPAGGSMLVYCDGVNVVEAVTSLATGGGINGTPDLILKSSGTEKMRIDAAGSVLLGTTASPVYGSKLRVQGGLELHAANQMNITTPAQFEIVNRGVGGFDFYVNLGATLAARIDAAGNVGIGTAPAADCRLHTSVTAGVNKSRFDAASGTDASVAVFVNTVVTSVGSENSAGGTLASGTTPFSTVLANNAARSLHLCTNNSVRATIDAAGFLGVNQAPSGATAITARHPSVAVNNYWQFGPNSVNDFVVMNQAGVGQFMANNSQVWSGTSDERLKTNFVEFADAVTKVATLRAGTGRFKVDEETVSRSFLIAQDVQAVLPEAVSLVPNRDDGMLGLAYTDVIPLLVAAIKELNLRLAALGG